MPGIRSTGRALLASLLLLPSLGCAGFVRCDPQPYIKKAAPTPAATRPNLLVVLSDDQRWDTLGVAGNPGIVTPVMDRMAREGVYFRQATVSVSQCHPVRASLITGLPAFAHGVYSTRYQEPGVADTLCRRPTVSSLLREAGYRTVLVGKWHLPTPPGKCGFDDVRTWLPEGGSEFLDPDLVRGRAAEAEPEHEKVPGFTQEIFADDAVGFLRSQDAQSGPFLLWLGFTAPHTPYEPNPERIQALYARRSEDELKPPGFPRDVAANDWRHYDEAVSHLDEQLGRVLAALQETGLAERTVVVFLGDNGYMMGERGLGGPGSGADGKQVPYESSLRVPFLLRGPGLPKAVASDLPVSSMDLPPTLLALAGVPVPDAWPGRNLQAAIAGEVRIGEAFAEWADEKSEKFGGLAYRVVRTPRHKLIVWKDRSKRDELYDLKADPAEVHNLVAEPAAQRVLQDLRGRLRAWMERNNDPALGW
ncbi:MAG TPA: sulfatase-like hydrolase/transferase [Thermoanaerobaculia bacterium]|nr:sulfatase-like hydrolase/transferase [Thermoanaerobaculia bacterium]